MSGYFGDDSDFFDVDDCFDDDPEKPCWRCNGEGYGIVGHDWSAIVGLSNDGEVERCKCCGGSGLAKDCTYW